MTAAAVVTASAAPGMSVAPKAAISLYPGMSSAVTEPRPPGHDGAVCDSLMMAVLFTAALAAVAIMIAMVVLASAG